MDNNLILDRVNIREIHDNLLLLLESVDDINIFCESCVKILAQYLKLKCLMLAIPHQDKMEVVYQYLDHNESTQYLSRLFEIITSDFDNLDHHFEIYFDRTCYKYINIDDNLKNNNINYLYLLPLHYKKRYFGNILIGIEYFLLSDNEVKKIFTLICKYLAIYLYHKELECREKEIQKKEEILTKNKINQSQYLSHMNHELRTPISAVIGFAKMLQQQLYGELNPKQIQYVEAIYQSGKYLLDLINDLLDLSKIEAQKEELYIEKILVHELCESCLALIKPKAEEKKLELILTIVDRVEYCYIDYRRIKQVLLNLLSNAVKFTEKGSITLEVKQDNHNLFFRVFDTGIGIKKESQHKLFQPFSQLNTPLHRQCKGTGLGLFISRELAKLHGGDITLISEENQGSCFTLNLPQKPS
ncbi:sensor histidine kinase [Geminocystis sp. CENA526]|uniref:sensor histidine kinase n=1 Tax=Geminocystis sp. CENA526 TaxID=1355871 RepID=UPI003D6FD73F